MNVEGLACDTVGARQVRVAVNFTDEHAECRNGLPVALVRGCTVARDQAELARLAMPPGGLGPDPRDVRVYVEPDSTDAESCLLRLTGFRVRRRRGGVKRPRLAGKVAGHGTGQGPGVAAGPPSGGQCP
jgi:hypothetical protein